MNRAFRKLNPTSSTFLVCDVQERFRDLIHCMPSVIHASSQMVKAAKIMDIPVYVSEQYPKGLGRTVPEIDTTTAKLVYEKTLFSMWTDELKAAMPKPEARSQVLLMGLETHVCVLQTCLDLLENGYEVHLLVDGASSQNPLDRTVGIQRMMQAGAAVTTRESALFQLTENAKAPFFKDISNLAKHRLEDGPSTLSNM